MERGRSQTTLTRRGRLVALKIYIFACSQGVTLYAVPIKSTVHLTCEAKFLLNSMGIVHENSTFNFSINTFFATVRLIEQYAKW